MYECEICGFQSMNKQALEMHKQKKHGGVGEKSKKSKSKKEKPETPKMGGVELNRVNIRLNSGKELSGVVKDITRFEIILKTDEGLELIVLKGNTEYVEKLD